MLGLLWMACAADGRRPIELPVLAGRAGEAAFTREDGVAFALDEATLTFADLRLEEPGANDGTAWLRALWPIADAVAHPGHDPSGAVAAELLGAFTVDLLDDDDALGDAQGYEGEFATGRVTVSGTVASLAGTLTPPGGAPIPFAIDVAADQDVLGIPFEETLSADDPPAAVAVRFDLAAALAFVDPAAGDTDGDGALGPEDEVFANAVRFGVVATPTWSLSLVP